MRSSRKGEERIVAINVVKLERWKRLLVNIEEPLPLVGTVFIGVIDRGTNVLQVRPTTLCPLNCIFCSVDAGPRSKWRVSEFIVNDPEWLVDWTLRVARVKNTRVEALIDGVGDPFTYDKLVELVQLLKENDHLISSVAVETHGWALDKKVIDKLNDVGLDRINLSIDTLDSQKARFLTGTSWYDIKKVRRMAEYIVKETSIDLHVTPVWVPGINDKDVIEVVEWAYNIGAGKRWPPATIQKYNAHRYGRIVKKTKPMTWRDFWRRIEELEQKTGFRVKWSMDEWGIKYAPRYEVPYRLGSKVRVRIISQGWIKGTHLGVTLDYNWLVTVRTGNYNVTGIVSVKITEIKDTIIMASII